MPIRIIITDDHPLVVSGLQTILRSSGEIEVSATYGSGDDLLTGLEQEQPDVLLMDLQMPGKLYGTELIRTIRRLYPDLPILVLSGQEALFNVKDVMAQGCKGYLLKNTTDQKMLVEAIKTVYYGDIFLESSLKDELLRGILKNRKAQEQAADIFTRRQVEIIQLLAEGNSSQQIAEKLYLSVRTIESHRHRLMQKLEAGNVTSLLKKATELGLIS